MGLDVSLHWYEDYETTNRLESEREKSSEKLWNQEMRKFGHTEFSELTRKERDAIQAKVKKFEDDFDDKHEIPDSNGIELPSEKHPEHMFKIGYWRSSYNSGGVNSVLKNALGKSLYYLIDRQNDEYIINPDWKDLAEKARELHKEFKEWAEKYGHLGIMEISLNEFSIMEMMKENEDKDEDEEVEDPFISTEREALEKFVKQQEHWSTHKPFGGGSYSNSDGQFFPEGKKVVGLLPGVRETFSQLKLPFLPCTYVVYEIEEGDGYEFYIQALEIVIETAEYVLNQSDPQKHCLHWSS